MEKLICNKNLALSAKAPSFLSKAYKGSKGTGQQGKRDPDVYNSRHFLFLFLTGGGQRTARMASSNTVLRPRCVSAEHSRYFTAPAGTSPYSHAAARARQTPTRPCHLLAGEGSGAALNPASSSRPCSAGSQKVSQTERKELKDRSPPPRTRLQPVSQK